MLAPRRAGWWSGYSVHRTRSAIALHVKTAPRRDGDALAENVTRHFPALHAVEQVSPRVNSRELKIIAAHRGKIRAGPPSDAVVHVVRCEILCRQKRWITISAGRRIWS